MIRAAAIAGLALLASACAGPRAPPSAPAPGLDWHFQTEGDTGKLAYGAPESDEVLLLLECRKGGADVLLSRPAPVGATPEIVVSAEGVEPTGLAATASPSQTHDGIDLDARVPLEGQLLAALEKGRWMGVRIGDETRRYTAQPATTAVDRFLAWCRA